MSNKTGDDSQYIKVRITLKVVIDKLEGKNYFISVMSYV